MSRHAVFAYGSLVSAESAERTIGRLLATPQPAELRGWRRRWSLVRDNLASEKTFAPADGGEPPPFVLGLNIERDETAADGPNGALIEMSVEQLDRLDLRELRYDRIDVTADVGSEQGFERVFSYTAKPGHFASSPPPGAVVLASYARVVEEGFAALGSTEVDRYRETTGPPPVEVIEAVLVDDRVPPGNPRDW